MRTISIKLSTFQMSVPLTSESGGLSSHYACGTKRGKDTITFDLDFPQTKKICYVDVTNRRGKNQCSKMNCSS